MPERGNTSLRIVDPYEDEGVWCIVDEGANSNTHGEVWLENAREMGTPRRETRSQRCDIHKFHWCGNEGKQWIIHVTHWFSS